MVKGTPRTLPQECVGKPMGVSDCSGATQPSEWPQVRQAFCCKTYALGCPTQDPGMEQPLREEVHVVDVPAPPVTVVHHAHHYSTVSEPVKVEPLAAPYDCDAGRGSSEGSSVRQVCLDFSCCRNGSLWKTHTHGLVVWQFDNS